MPNVQVNEQVTIRAGPACTGPCRTVRETAVRYHGGAEEWERRWRNMSQRLSAGWPTWFGKTSPKRACADDEEHAHGGAEPSCLPSTRPPGTADELLVDHHVLRPVEADGAEGYPDRVAHRESRRISKAIAAVLCAP